MASVFIAALFALTAPQAPPPSAPVLQDLRCYGLMATLAEHDDQRIRSAGLTGAQYFLGRIDAHTPGFDPQATEQEPVAEAEHELLISQCSALMGAGGRDFRALGGRLASERGTI